jgi:nucleotide-binding universal stress UspA family protein
MALTILVPLDGTPFGEAALPAAASIAEDAHARLLLFEAIPPADHSHHREDEEANGRANALDYLHGVQGRVIRQFGLEQVYIEAEPAHPVEGIVETARKWNAGLVVMATHRRTGADRILHGSVAEAVLSAGKVPVAFVRPAKAD